MNKDRRDGHGDGNLAKWRGHLERLTSASTGDRRWQWKLRILDLANDAEAHIVNGLGRLIV